MTWTKLSDDFTDDCWTLSDAAYRLHTDGLVWSNRKLLDCVIPKEDLRRFAKRPEAVQELLDAGYWSDAGDSYLLRHHAQYQRKREAVIKQQEANAANGAKGGKGKKPGTGAPREQFTGSAINAVPMSPSESLSGSPDERDRTGQALALYKRESSEVSSEDSEPADEHLEFSAHSTSSASASGPSTCSVAGCTGPVTEWLQRTYGQICFSHAKAVAS